MRVISERLPLPDRIIDLSSPVRDVLPAFVRAALAPGFHASNILAEIAIETIVFNRFQPEAVRRGVIRDQISPWEAPIEKSMSFSGFTFSMLTTVKSTEIAVMVVLAAHTEAGCICAIDPDTVMNSPVSALP